MLRPVSLYIGLRYTRAKKRNHFISFISGISTLGIAIGISVLITVLSVMNGFDEQIKKKVFTMVPEVTVSNHIGALTNWQSLSKRVAKYPGVLGVAPYAQGQALLSHGGSVLPVMISGIDPKRQLAVSDISQSMAVGSFDNLDVERFGIILGQSLALRLNVRMGDKVVVMTPQGSVTPIGFVPRVKRFTVVGIFHAGDGMNFDGGYAFIGLKDAQSLYKLGEGVSGLRLKIQDAFRVNEFTLGLNDELDGLYAIGNWTAQLGAFFHAIALEKNMMFIILLMIIAVAAFNLVTSLVMLVNEKSADIAILRTLGATPQTITLIFLIQGAVVGLFSLVLGLLGGIALTMNVNSIAEFIQNTFHVQLISSSVYIVDYLPHKFMISDIWRVCAAAFGMSLLATIYPAISASRTQPAEALRYE